MEQTDHFITLEPCVVYMLSSANCSPFDSSQTLHLGSAVKLTLKEKIRFYNQTDNVPEDKACTSMWADI